MSAEYLKHFNEMRFTVVATPDRCKVSFVIYDIAGWNEGVTPGVFDVPCWHKAESSCWPDSVNTLDEAEVYLTGQVKLDGCSDWHFDEQDRLMLHGCSRDDIERFGKIMAACWDWATEILLGARKQ